MCESWELTVLCFKKAKNLLRKVEETTLTLSLHWRTSLPSHKGWWLAVFLCITCNFAVFLVEAFLLPYFPLQTQNQFYFYGSDTYIHLIPRNISFLC